MSGDAGWKLRLNLAGKAQVKQAVFAAVQEVFELDIKPEAQTNTPVLTGTNKRSIDTEVTMQDNGSTKATLFTQSGYGGYLELGTKKMAARPYLYPAFNRFRNKISELTATKIRAIK